MNTGGVMIRCLLVTMGCLIASLCLFADNTAIPLPAEDMVTVTPGSYTPLYRESGVVKRVFVGGFLLDKYQVTNQQFVDFLQKHPQWQAGRISPHFADTSYLNHLSTSLPEYADSPVVNVSWYAAMAYCKAQGKTLPTVDQWEYAGRASDKRADGTNEEAFRQKILRWYSRPARELPPSVYDTDANFWGVHGMHGVVWEQVKDFNSALVTGESRADSSMDNQFFCGAGSSQAIDPSDYAAFMRYAFRSSYQASYTLSSLGFRCAKVP